MSNIVRTTLGNLHETLELTLSPADFEPKLKTELNKYRKKAQIKGFRKGKTPMGMIRKLYGKAILADVVNELLQSTLLEYIKEEDLDILGQPIPAEDQVDTDLDPNDLKTIIFKFEIGLAPEFEVQGLDADNKFEQYSVEVPEETILKDLETARTRVGKRESVDDEIVERDMLEINAEELDGDASKENGWAMSFSIVADDHLVEEFRTQVMGKKVGDKLRFNINEVEKDRDSDFVRKYLLKATDADAETEIGDHFEGTISEVNRVVPADLDQEFFDKYFGEGKVSTEEEAKAKIEADVKKYYDRQAESLLFRDFQDNLLERNTFELPDTFLRRWLLVSNEGMTPERVETEYTDFSKNLQWSLLRSKMVRKFEVEVTEEELLEGFKDRIRGYFGGYGDELIVLNTANRLMQDQKQVDQLYQELMADKLFEELRKVVTVSPKLVPTEEFEAIVAEAQKEIQARQQNQSIPESVEESEEEEVADVE